MIKRHYLAIKNKSICLITSLRFYLITFGETIDKTNFGVFIYRNLFIVSNDLSSEFIQVYTRYKRNAFRCNVYTCNHTFYDEKSFYCFGCLYFCYCYSLFVKFVSTFLKKPEYFPYHSFNILFPFI